MKTRRTLSVLVLLALLLSLFSGLTASAKEPTSASEVNYRKNGKYVYNWGTRDTTATFLTTYAQSYYTGSYSYTLLSSKSGSTSTSASDIYGSALGSAIHSMLKAKQTSTTSYNGTKELYRYTDCEENQDKISSYYSAVAIGPGWGEGGSWNREHTWPNSKGLNGADENDIMMLRPTATSENSSRGNTAYGEGSGYYNPNQHGQNLHGDVARLMLQHLMRWGNTSKFYGSGGVMESRAVLLKWLEEDPVDTWEMGRNDAVQSITGVRNVFVDYPELAFRLLGEDVPANYPTPSNGGSGETPVTYTLTAVSSNTAYGTVSLSGKTITAAPKTGYQIDDTTPYTVSPAGAATVTRSGNVFTVSNLKDNCTVTIHFTARQTANVTYHVPSGVTVSGTTSGYVGDSIRLATVSGQPNGTDSRFYGWASGNVAKTTTAPTVRAAGSAYTLTAAQADFYGVFAMDEGGTTYYTTNPIVCTHEHTKTESRAATCTEGGYERTVCLDCGMELAGTSEPALGHDYQPSVVAPTCTAKGYTLHTCSRCGENYKNAYTDALGHSYRDGKCTVCGEKDPNYQPPVDNTPKYEDFKDLPANAWYKESVGYALANGLMNGTGDGIFQPDGALTRAMLVTILYRSAGEPSVDGLKNPFQDVADGQWYTKAVVWAAGKGIVNGTSETTFDPDASITREQIAAILHRYAGKPETKGELASFPDAATVSDYAKTAMAWTVEKGIIGGSDGKLDPRSNATRAQVAAILMRYLTANRPQ